MKNILKLILEELKAINKKLDARTTSSDTKICDSLEELCKPIVEYLKKEGYAYPTVVIRSDQILLTTDQISIPIKY